MHPPTRAAEFPNDNPALHRGARWVCRHPRGAARAVVRAPDLVDAAGRVPPTSSLDAAPAAAGPPAPAFDAVARALQLGGPLELDLDRIVLPHRVENVPPPPEFVFRPFVPARRRDPGLAPGAVSPPLQPLAYRVVDQWDAACRVRRGWRVDIAPCLAIGSGAAVVEPAVRQVAQPEVVRRPRRRGASLSVRVASPSPLATEDELSRAISELESAFADGVGAEHVLSSERPTRIPGNVSPLAVSRRAAGAS